MIQALAGRTAEENLPVVDLVKAPISQGSFTSSTTRAPQIADHVHRQSLRRFYSSVFCFATLLCFSQKAAANDTFEHRFGFSTAQEPALNMTLPSDRKTVKISKAGILITHQQNDGLLDSIGGKTRFGIRGDGTIRFEFTVRKMSTPDQGLGNGVMMRLEFCDKAESGVTIALHAAPDGVLYWQSDHTVGGQEEHAVHKIPAFTDVFESPQTIEVTRTNSRLTINSGATGRLRLLDERQVSTSDIYPVAIWVGTGGGKADLAIKLNSWEMNADQLANDSGQVTSVSSWRWLFWCFGVLAIVASGLLVRQHWQTGG